jgi:hypothetical protein
MKDYSNKKKEKERIFEKSSNPDELMIMVDEIQ